MSNHEDSGDTTQKAQVNKAPERAEYATLNREDKSRRVSSASQRWTDIDLGNVDEVAIINKHAHPTLSTGEPSPTSPVTMLGCALVDRDVFARRQAVRRASGEDDQTYLDKSGQSVTTPTAAAIQRWQQEIQDPFQDGDSVRSLPMNVYGVESIELQRLRRPHFPARTQAEAGGPSLTPIEERRRMFYHQSVSQASRINESAAYISDFERGYLSNRAILRRRRWYACLLICSCIPFISLWAYNNKHDATLSWLTGGETNRLTSAQRRNLGICGCLSFLFLVFAALLISVLAARHSLAD